MPQCQRLHTDASQAPSSAWDTASASSHLQVGCWSAQVAQQHVRHAAKCRGVRPRQQQGLLPGSQREYCVCTSRSAHRTSGASSCRAAMSSAVESAYSSTVKAVVLGSVECPKPLQHEQDTCQDQWLMTAAARCQHGKCTHGKRPAPTCCQREPLGAAQPGAAAGPLCMHRGWPCLEAPAPVAVLCTGKCSDYASMQPCSLSTWRRPAAPRGCRGPNSK